MPNKRDYTDSQQANLDKLRALHDTRMLAKRNLRIEIEAAARTRLKDMELEESRQMNVCLNDLSPKGFAVSKSDIGRAVGTMNWDYLKNMYSLTEHEFVRDWAYHLDHGKKELILTRFKTWEGNLRMRLGFREPAVAGEPVHWITPALPEEQWPEGQRDQLVALNQLFIDSGVEDWYVLTEELTTALKV